MIPEMPRLFPLDRLGECARFVVQAQPSELAPLAVRLGLLEVKSLTCAFELVREPKATVRAHGRLAAAIAQTCVISLDPFDVEIEEDFAVRFVPEGSESDELDLEALDEIPYQAGALDLGEAAAEQLALALDPFPRKPDAELPQTEGGDGPGGKFAALGKLRGNG